MGVGRGSGEGSTGDVMRPQPARERARRAQATRKGAEELRRDIGYPFQPKSRAVNVPTSFGVCRSLEPPVM